jgi:hypothetical protein
MKLQMFAAAIAGLLLAASAIVPVARADEANQATIFTFQQPVRIPGHVLLPGKYIFELIDGGNTSDLNLIQIFDANRTKLIATIQTASAERMDAYGKTVLTFDFRKNGRLPILLAWYYPGDLIGHEFIYSKKVERQVSRADEVTFAVGRSGATPINSPEGNG